MWAEAIGFEPMDRSSRPPVFKTGAIDHSAKPPNNVPRLGLEPRPRRLRVWCATINAIEASNYFLFLLQIIDYHFTMVIIEIIRICLLYNSYYDSRSIIIKIITFVEIICTPGGARTHMIQFRRLLPNPFDHESIN